MLVSIDRAKEYTVRHVKLICAAGLLSLASLSGDASALTDSSPVVNVLIDVLVLIGEN